jgi:hypothetical protein
MTIGFGLILGPLALLADVVPFLGEISRFGTAFIAIGVALVRSLVIIALGWIAYGPVRGVAVLIMAGVPSSASSSWSATASAPLRHLAANARAVSGPRS